jgi:hypothetical protein
MYRLCVRLWDIVSVTELLGTPFGTQTKADKQYLPAVANRCEQQGRERKVTRSIGSGYGYGYGYDGQMSDPQGMPLTGNVPWGWGTTGHAANRHCPLE